ncbi:MAG TPA: ribonuclease E/G, partial [Hellea balneolensis]|nr:ribonuclease E/G [Hellea balneolensis]
SVPQGMGVIVRTAGAKRTKAEIKRDYDYLSRLWDTIREKTLESIAPALIHEEGNLVKRSIRDLYGKEIEKVLVQGDEAYRVAKNFIKMLMPSHAKNVQPYKDEVPLFLRYQVEQQIESCLEPIAQLKSGGYLVIHPTEALVSIDVNSGRSTKERNVERTALKTNLEAAVEVARQMRLRDLAGLIVIDFIDMDENRNNRAVEKKMREVLSKDRARVQMGRISQFGLMEISRQRRRRSLLEGSTASCEHCHGVGRKRSVESSALKAVHAIEEEGIRGRAARIRLAVSPDVANYLFNEKRNLLNSVDERFNMFTEVIADPNLIRPKLEITVVEAKDNGGVDALEEIQKEHRKERSKDKRRRNKKTEQKTEAKTETDDEQEQPARSKRKRRRGRRGGRGRNAAEAKANQQTQDAQEDTQIDTEDTNAANADEKSADTEKIAEKPAKPKRGRRRKSPVKEDDKSQKDDQSEETKSETSSKSEEAIPAAKTKRRTRKKPTAEKPETSKSSDQKQSKPDAPDLDDGDGEPKPVKKPARKSRTPKAKTVAKPKKAEPTKDKKDKAVDGAKTPKSSKTKAKPKSKPKKGDDAKDDTKNTKTVKKAETTPEKPTPEPKPESKPEPKKKGWWQKRNPFG